MDQGGFYVAALIALGMGGAVWITDRENPSSRALALLLVLTAIAIVANVLAGAQFDQGRAPLWLRGIGFLECFAFLAGTEWGLRVGRTVVTPKLFSRGVWLIRAAQALAFVYAALVAAFPELRDREFEAFQSGALPGAVFFLFVAPPALAGALVLIAGFVVLRGRPDRAEAGRILTTLAAMPLLTSALILPKEVAPLALGLGEIVILLGLLQYHVVQGARGQFMAQFLAPQVAELVRSRGLKNAMARQRLTVTVVFCDIRGFTAYAQGQNPEKVMHLLRDFYGSLGAVAARYGGTIKDLAGDGALILLGAPIPFADSAQRALALARRLQEKTRPVVQRYSPSLGLGVGVATGDVAVGIVGQGARYEYVAVGPTVNLASRLCDEARDGEIRADAQSLTAAGEALPGKSELRALKGVGREVATYVLPLA